jgi:sugar O-acyltransferase (sialic acid O-acetyltransferase NeuD family)
MATRIIIIGTGGNALDVLDVIDSINRTVPTWDVVGFIDDSRAVGSQFEGRDILSGLRDAGSHKDCLFMNSIGSDRSYRKRPDFIASTRLELDRFATLVHPLAAVSPRAKLGQGVCVNAGACVSGGVSIGSHVWLGAGCVIGHDTVIHDFAMIAPRAVVSGYVHIDPGAYVGGGACIRQRVTIGERALVGLGGVVIADVVAGTTVVGNPARVMVRQPKSRSSDTPPARPGLIDTPTPKKGDSLPGDQ